MRAVTPQHYYYDLMCVIYGNEKSAEKNIESVTEIDLSTNVSWTYHGLWSNICGATSITTIESLRFVCVTNGYCY